MRSKYDLIMCDLELDGLSLELWTLWFLSKVTNGAYRRDIPQKSVGG